MFDVTVRVSHRGEPIFESDAWFPRVPVQEDWVSVQDPRRGEMIHCIVRSIKMTDGDPRTIVQADWIQNRW